MKETISGYPLAQKNLSFDTQKSSIFELLENFRQTIAFWDKIKEKDWFWAGSIFQKLRILAVKKW